MSESTLTRQVMKWLRSQPGWWYKTCDLFTVGIPDILGCRSGKFIAIELKTEKGRVTKLQAHVLSQIQKRGGSICVARNLNEVKQFIEAL